MLGLGGVQLFSQPDMKFPIMRELENVFLLLHLLIFCIAKDVADLYVFIFNLPLDSIWLMRYIFTV